MYLRRKYSAVEPKITIMNAATATAATLPNDVSAGRSRKMGAGNVVSKTTPGSELLWIMSGRNVDEVLDDDAKKIDDVAVGVDVAHVVELLSLLEVDALVVEDKKVDDVAVDVAIACVDALVSLLAVVGDLVVDSVIMEVAM